MLALGEEDVTPLPDNAEYGINKLFPAFSQLCEQGKVAVIQQVGYPDSNGPHFENKEIYE